MRVTACEAAKLPEDTKMITNQPESGYKPVIKENCSVQMAKEEGNSRNRRFSEGVIWSQAILVLRHSRPALGQSGQPINLPTLRVLLLFNIVLNTCS